MKRFGIAAIGAAEGIAIDAAGNIFGAEAGPERVNKYVRQ